MFSFRLCAAHQALHVLTHPSPTCRSSDLNAPSALHRAAGASGAAAWARAAASAGAIIPIVRAAIAATAYPCSMIVSVNLVIRALPPASAAPVGGTGRRSLAEQELGRASCRERGWPYV